VAAKKRARRRYCGLKCSLERWKCSGFFENETTRTDVDTAALDQPGDEAGLMAEDAEIGNDEPSHDLHGRMA
jgi:hypothetical protein